MISYKGVNVTMSDFRQCHFCAGGVRRGFARYNLDYPKFLESGIDADELLSATNYDSMVMQAVEVANGRQQ
jgi:hypothetical protein